MVVSVSVLGWLVVCGLVAPTRTSDARPPSAAQGRQTSKARAQGRSAKRSNTKTGKKKRTGKLLDPLPPLELERDSSDERTRQRPPRARPRGSRTAARKTATGRATTDASGPQAAYELQKTEVKGQRRLEAAPAASYAVEIGKLRYIPRKSAAEALMLAPGVLTTNAGGEGHAHETFMRGFAAREGQDIEFSVDGVPLNEVSNPHGHGYTDLHFLPPELISAVHITEGPFHPAQGDFAFAGSADYRLAVDQRGARVKYGYGSFATHRLFLLLAPKKQDRETFAGFEFFRTAGYGENRAAQRALAVARYARTHKKLKLRWKVSVFGYAGRFDQAGVVRKDDYAAGRMGFYDTYDTNQGGESNRFLLAFHTAWGPRRSLFETVTFFGYRKMRLRANFTGWLTDDPLEEEQRGDSIEMRYRVLNGGSRGRYTLKRRFFGHEQKLAMGYALRFDRGNSSQLRLRSVSAIPYEREFDHDFTIMNLAGWLALNLRPWQWMAVRGGVRIDTFSFGITDLNGPTADREGVRESDTTVQAFGYAVNPRFTVDFTLYRGLHLLASYGQGTRSTEAAALSDNETAPFARSHQGEVGVSYQWGHKRDPWRVKTQASYVYAYVDKDLLFSETEGRNVLIGASTRHAVLLGSRLDVGGWLDVLLNCGWTHAVLEETGELFPYIPQLVLRLDAAIKGRLFSWKLGRVPVTGRFGVGFTYVPGRPLPLEQRGDSFYLLNAGGQVRLWHVSLGLEMRNLFNLKYRQTEFYYASNFRGPTALPSRVAEHHFVAGEPLFVMGTLTLHVEDIIHRFSE
jgi:hypothetical protein